MLADEPRDPWDHPIELVDGAEFGAAGTWVVSAGPDGVFGTEDDFRARLGQPPAGRGQ